MPKVIIIFCLIIGLLITTNFLNQLKAHKKHLQELKNLFPYALLTDDYDILTADDLATNSCDANPKPFSEESFSYPYWQCFNVKQIKFRCDPSGPDDQTKKETAILLIDVKNPEKQLQYVPRRAMDMDNCRWFENSWKHGTLNQDFACLAGSFAGFEKDNHNYEVEIWVFDKFKTKRLCNSYFYGHCSLNYMKKNGCEI